MHTTDTFNDVFKLFMLLLKYKMEVYTGFTDLFYILAYLKVRRYLHTIT